MAGETPTLSVRRHAPRRRRVLRRFVPADLHVVHGHLGSPQLAGAPQRRTGLGPRPGREGRSGEQHSHGDSRARPVARAYGAAMGMDPRRRRVAHRGDLAFVIIGVGVALALVAWALLGSGRGVPSRSKSDTCSPTRQSRRIGVRAVITRSVPARATRWSYRSSAPRTAAIGTPAVGTARKSGAEPRRSARIRAWRERDGSERGFVDVDRGRRVAWAPGSRPRRSATRDARGRALRATRPPSDESAVASRA